MSRFKAIIPSLIVAGMLLGATAAHGQEKTSPDPVSGKLDALAKEIKKLQDDLAGNFLAVSKAFDDLKAKSKMLGEQITSLQDAVADLKMKCDDALARVKALEEKSKTHIAQRPPTPKFTDTPPKKSTSDNPKDDSVLSRIVQLELQMQKMRQEVSELKKRIAFYPPDDTGLADIRKRLEQLEKQLAQAGPKRTAKSPTPTGKLELVNTSSELMLFVVNGTAYRVDPGSFKRIDVQPAGTIEYEVIRNGLSSGLRRTHLNAGETLRLTAS